MHTEKHKTADAVSYQQNSIVSKQIIKKPNGNITLFAFDKDESLAEHTSPFDALVQIIDGQMNITVGGEEYSVSVGEHLLLPAGIPHGLKAPAPCKMLLTMIK